MWYRQTLIRGCAAAAPALFLSGLVLLGTACSGPETGGKLSHRLSGTAADEIFSYRREDPRKTTITAAVLGNDSAYALAAKYEESHPDTQIVLINMQQGGKDYSPARDWLEHGYRPDLVFNLDLSLQDPAFEEDLSAYPILSRYTASSLEEFARDGRIYCLPGPAKVMAIAYNKTLFGKYGWKLPDSFDGFVRLCDRIDADTGGKIRPYQPNGKYTLDFMAGMEAFAYGPLFSGVANHAWYDSWLSGKAPFSKHMRPIYEMAARMAEHGILKASDFSYSYTSRTRAFYEGRIAMIEVMTISSFPADSSFEFAYMPFPALDGSEGCLPLRADYNVCVPKKSRSTTEQKALETFLDYFSTPEAQDTYIGKGIMQSPLKSAAKDPDSRRSAGSLNTALSNGRAFSRIDFSAQSGNTDVLELIRGEFLSIASGKMDIDAALADFEARYPQIRAKAVGPGSGADRAGDILAAVKNDFTVLETSEYIADKFREASGADIALIPDNSLYRGNIHRMFSGSIDAGMLVPMTPRSLDNGSALIKARMSGAQLLAALNDPPDYDGARADCIYAASGLKIRAAPWNEPGGKYLSVSLADGSALVPDAQYTVAFWQGMVRDKYIAETVTVYPGSYSDILGAALKKDRAIAPAKDGRMTLVWN